MKISAKIRKRINLVFKIILVSLVYIFLFVELANHKQDFWRQITHNTSSFTTYYLWMALLLMPVNWLIESIKWKFLVKKIENVPLWDAIQAVFAGTAISIFTPNRIGDYLGRIFILKKGDRLDGTVATITGNLSQLLVTLVMGSVSFIYFLNLINEHYLTWSPLMIFILKAFIIIVIVILIFAFFSFPQIEYRINKNFEIYKYPFLRHLNLLAEFKSSDLIKVLFLSLLRFLVYSFQFYLLFKAFQINMNFGEGMLIVFLVFLGITIVPSIAVAELGVRGIIVLFIFNILWNNDLKLETFEVSMISATSLLWFINIALPALIGGLFIFNLRFIRKSDAFVINDESLEKGQNNIVK